MDQIQGVLNQDEYFLMSPQGLLDFQKNYDPNQPLKNLLWTTDNKLELPIRMKKQGHGSEAPITLIEMLDNAQQKYGNNVAMMKKINKQWVPTNYKQLFEQCCDFAKACISYNINENKAVNIIGFNAPQWMISFFGSIFGSYLPVGVYTTNQEEACLYVAQHSMCELVVAENNAQLKKYLNIWNQLPDLKLVVVYDDSLPKDLPEQYRDRVVTWTTFMQKGKQSNENNLLQKRRKDQTAGRCCTLVYTSGTTGLPKGVMLSHDNYTFIAKKSNDLMGTSDSPQRGVSYLPLSHVAAQVQEISCLMFGGSIYFADPSALQGSLVDTLREVRPTWFLGVPRVWEKIEEKMKHIGSQNGFIKQNIGNWAKSMGNVGTYNEENNLPNGYCFGVAKSLIYNKVKETLGLDQCKNFIVGAAPLTPTTQDYFLSLNIFIKNGYGMSECAGPQTITSAKDFASFDKAFLKSCGQSYPGLDLLIANPDSEGNGEICFKGRNRFMGYFRNEKATQETIDEQGFLHSGDMGKLDKKGNLSITGRFKELIITAGGENVAPVLIENEIKHVMGNFINNAMVIGEQKKYLTVLLTMKQDMDKNGKPQQTLSPECKGALKALGINSQTVKEAQNDQALKKLIDAGILEANKKAISKAQHIIKWAILDDDFTQDGGELTPTMKLKRNVAAKKHEKVIDSLYLNPSL